MDIAMMSPLACAAIKRKIVSKRHAADHIVMPKPYPQNLWITLWTSSQKNIAYFEKMQRNRGRS